MNYDYWKLSNPTDNGFGYNMVSSCCGTEYDEDDTGINCLCCGDDCDIIEDYEYEALQRENYLEERGDAKRKYGE